MNLARQTTETLLALRRNAEVRRDWSTARRITVELHARGESARARLAS